ncbi:MAG: HEAT repeat domain-containing protein [Acidobacteriota bacterium]
MSWVQEYRADKAIEAILAAPVSSIEHAQAVERLQQIGAPAIPRILTALSQVEQSTVLESTLVDFLDDQTLPYFRQGLYDPDPRIAETSARVLARSSTWDPNLLLPLFLDETVHRDLLTAVLVRRAPELMPGPVMRLIDEVDFRGLPLLLKLVERVVTDSQVSDVVRRLDHTDARVRLALVRLLVRFPTPEVQKHLVRLLAADGEKKVRLAAIEALVEQELPTPLGPLVRLLRDRDLIVQQKAIETLIDLARPETVELLTPLLDDGDQRVRRAAVEVLNKLRSPSTVKLLVKALDDSDWWVRTRAADALSQTGGAEVVSRVLPLVEADDEELREVALEIFDRSRDSSVRQLLERRIETGDETTRRRAEEALRDLDRRQAARTQDIVADDRSPQVAPTLPAMERPDSTAEPRPRDMRLQPPSSLFGDELPPPSVVASGPPATLEESFDPLALRPGARIGGRYRFVRRIGRGGFGVVVLVEDLMVQEQVVLKFLDPEIAASHNAIERFKRELRFARRVTHENIIRIYDLLAFGDTLAISMEYFPSHALSAELHEGWTVEVDRGVRILIGICHGLGVAHRAGVVHRDLKPGNVLIGEDDQVKVVDFGLAAAAVGEPQDNRLTRSGLVVGTPLYMAPEQIRNRPLDGRTDIYCLGILMYEMFAGRLPYDGEGMEVMGQHLKGDAVPPAVVNPALPDELDAVIRKAMAVRPENRFADAETLALELAKVMSD